MTESNDITTVLTASFSVNDGMCDEMMEVDDASKFPERGALKLEDTVISYDGIDNSKFTNCNYVSGSDSEFEVGTNVNIGKTPYFYALQTIYYLVGITLEEKVNLMLTALGFTYDIKKWNEAFPIDRENPYSDREWTIPDTEEKEILEYDKYGKPAEIYNENYSVNYVGPANGWYYEQ